MSKKFLGLNLSANAIGWALLEETHGRATRIIDLGCRVLVNGVEEKTPASGKARLNRRILQLKAGRKQRLLNYLLKLKLLPEELRASPNPEAILNRIGNPYHLRAKALDQKLSEHELGRVILHLVQRGGFSRSRRAVQGDMIDDPDVLAVLAGLKQGGHHAGRGNQEADFNKDVDTLKAAIKEAGCRTLGEYLSRTDLRGPRCIRVPGGRVRTDRKMYEDELDLIWQRQHCHHPLLTEPVKMQVERILFYQSPAKLRTGPIGRCALEPKRKPAVMARLESQRFRYLQTINSLTYFKQSAEHEAYLSTRQKDRLISLFEAEAEVAFPKIRALLGFDETTEFNLERSNKTLKGNVTACRIRDALSLWDDLGAAKQQALVEDLLTIGKKPVLEKRLVRHWGFDPAAAAGLCRLELEPGHCQLSVKAINRLLPFLYRGQRYSDARISAGYGPEIQVVEIKHKLGAPPETVDPVMKKVVRELRRLVNALNAEYGKPDVIRVRMARDLDMNAKRYAGLIKRQKAHVRMNEEAALMFQDMRRRHPHLFSADSPDQSDRLKYRLWRDQHHRCAYSGRHISPSALFGSEVEIGHILPYSESLDDSYMNKVLCYREENSSKGQKTPIDAFGAHEAQWHQIVQNLSRWSRSLAPKKKRFFMTAAQVRKTDFIDRQLNDGRRISRIVHDYLTQLGGDVSVSKGAMTGWIRQQWDLHRLSGNAWVKCRADHRFHAIDALVIACLDRAFYERLADAARDLELKQSRLNPDALSVEPAWKTLREDLQHALDNMMVMQAPRLESGGPAHEETGAGRVCRSVLDDAFTEVDNIVDPAVQEIVRQHLERFNGKPKDAFAEGVTVYHKDGKTPIRRVRIQQPEDALSRPETARFSAKDQRMTDY